MNIFEVILITICSLIASWLLITAVDAVKDRSARLVVCIWFAGMFVLLLYVITKN